MFNGIDSSRVVLLCLTKRYLEKVDGSNFMDNCYLELMYSSTKMEGPRNIIPMRESKRMERSFRVFY
jgi:hypothetical protein